MKEGIDYIGVGVGVFILNENGEVLLMKRGAGAKNEVNTWILPGGSVGVGETMRDAIIRETYEELAVEIEIDGQLPAYDHILPEEGQHWVTSVFSARIVHGIPEIQEPEKCDELGWFSLDNLPIPLASASQGAIDSFIHIGQ